MPRFLRSCGRALAIGAACAVLTPIVQAGNNVAATSPAHAANALKALAEADTSDRFIVRFRDAATDPGARAAAVGATFGERLDHLRAMSGGAHVLRLGRRVMRAEARELAARLRTDARIASVEVDARLQPMLVPNDTMYAQQWHYFEAAGGINLPRAWDVTTGSAAIAVAVIDTGIVPHADLAGRVVGGYDFVGDAASSNDGDGRDGNAADPGDFGCNGGNSSWHGTHVAGTIGALSNNGYGVSGINWVSRIVPVRVLGKCGGYTSDIIDGMRWAAGIAVPGVPANPYPARVENLSLGGDGACSAAFQSAINDVTARGTVVVVAAGNSNVDAANAQPASCNGVIAVAATKRNGGKASYSNYGSKVTIAAPGGDGNDGILSTLNSGATTPGADSYAWYQGTSMATPHVSGVVSLMLSVDPSLTPAQVTQRLRQAARPFPAGTGADCMPALCGAGIIDAAASLGGLATTPAPAPSPGWSKIADEGQNFTVDGTRTVRYGSGAYWISRDVTGSGNCSNAFFATDPIPGVAKECQVSSAAVSTPAGWSRIASEGQDFSLTGTQTVRYGSGLSWITKAVTSSGSCTNAFFGSDPAYGVIKQCEVNATVPGETWTPIAAEGQSFPIGGSHNVRYGSGSSWITKSVTAGGSCTSAFFGNDPIYGVFKQCQVSSL